MQITLQSMGLLAPDHHWQDICSAYRHQLHHCPIRIFGWRDSYTVLAATLVFIPSLCSYPTFQLRYTGHKEVHSNIKHPPGDYFLEEIPLPEIPRWGVAKSFKAEIWKLALTRTPVRSTRRGSWLLIDPNQPSGVTYWGIVCIGGAPLPLVGHIWDVMLVWRTGNINKNCLCVTVLCTIIMVHEDTSSSYRSVNCIRLWSCLV